MKEIFNTKNLRTIHEACNKSMIEKTVSIVIGANGCGKTTAIEEYCANRSNVLLVRHSFNSSLVVPGGIELVVIDGLSVSSDHLSQIVKLIKRTRGIGFVVSWDSNPFFSKGDFMRRDAFRILGALEPEPGIPTNFDYRRPCKISGAVNSFVKDEHFRESFVIIRANVSGLNTIYMLRRPTREDVKSICEFYGVDGANRIYLNGKTIRQVINEIQWKRSKVIR